MLLAPTPGLPTCVHQPPDGVYGLHLGLVLGHAGDHLEAVVLLPKPLRGSEEVKLYLFKLLIDSVLKN